MNMMGYDAMAVGPNELSLGPELLRLRIEAATFAVVSANVVISSTGELLTEPFAIIERAGRRLAVIGVTRIPQEPAAGFRVLDPLQAVAAAVQEARAQADSVVVLTNLPYRAGLDLAASVPGIDLLVAALPGQLPKDVVTVPGTGTLVVSAEQPVARHTGRRVGKLIVTIQSDGSFRAGAWETRFMDRTLVDDFAMTALLSSYR